ncbi:Uncharacterised protein [uncultured archaeon]|nr:Uncharacterised protein [uncultured archaeon]
MEKVMSVYWFAIIFIVAGAIVYMVSNFYGEPYDIREVESNALVYQISNCLIPELYLKMDAFNAPDFFSYCKLTFETEKYAKWENDSQFFVSVVVSDFSTGSVIFSNQTGSPSLNDFCDLQKNGHQKNLPYCLSRKVYAVDSEGTQYFVNMDVAINKGEKNAKL